MNHLLKPKTNQQIQDDFLSLNLEERFEILLEYIRKTPRRFNEPTLNCNYSLIKEANYGSSQESYIIFERWESEFYRDNLIRMKSIDIFNRLYYLSIKDNSLKLYYGDELILKYPQFNYLTFQIVINYFEDVIRNYVEKTQT